MNWPLFSSTFLIIFLAELGDKTQLAVMSRAADASARWTLFFAAVLALALSTAVAVLAGAAINRVIPPRAIKLAGGALFVFFGILMLRDAFVKSGPDGHNEPRVENTQPVD